MQLMPSCSQICYHWENLVVPLAMFVFALCYWSNTRMRCWFVASGHSDKNLSNRLDYLSRLPFASLFIDNSWLITETVSNLQENQSSSWRHPPGAATTPTLCSNAAHCAYYLSAPQSGALSRLALRDTRTIPSHLKLWAFKTTLWLMVIWRQSKTR